VMRSHYVDQFHREASSDKLANRKGRVIQIVSQAREAIGSVLVYSIRDRLENVVQEDAR